MKLIEPILRRHSDDFADILGFPISAVNASVIDLSAKNHELASTELLDTAAFSNYIFNYIDQLGKQVAVGGYNEERIIYQRSHLFDEADEHPRFIHLGIDVWAKPGTHLYAPLKGVIHSFKNNIGFGDFGPTIVLQHELEGVTFYTLYGHLSENSIAALQVGSVIERNQLFATIGDYPTNGDWPAHVHFQIITDMLDYKGDFAGVCASKDRVKFLGLCPNPNLILKIPLLP